MSNHNVHLRVPPPVYGGVAERAQQERRTWAQMCVIILEDALATQKPVDAQPAVADSANGGEQRQSAA